MTIQNQNLADTESGRDALCIGVDVGGTFTDVILSNGTAVWRAKARSTPGALGNGVLAGCRLVAEAAGMDLSSMLSRVDRFGLGTTAVTNDIASRVGLRVGLITTRGFEDMVPIARARRVARDGWLVPPDSLIERECIRGIEERIDCNGQIVTQLGVAQVVEAGRQLVEDEKAEVLVVSFLWACVNPEHEAAAVAALREAMPTVTVLSAAALHPVAREYERTTNALLNAYTMASLNGVEELVDELIALGLSRPPLLVHSGGGSITVAEGRGSPALLAESGPAAGVVGAVTVCQAAGVEHAVACDMGGTSFDMAVIRNGQPMRRNRGELMGIWTAMPMVDIESITAGGGSIAWVDALGMLRVGPRSAGSNPGPACYGFGGTNATVTDALLVLGYIDPGQFLGGGMRLDMQAALDACGRIGAELGCDARKAAWGIHEIAKTGMVSALRAQFAMKGVDPGDHAIVNMGGCGGLFTAVIAAELGVKRVLAPELSSVLSAFGSANADIRRERSVGVGVALPASTEDLQARADALMARVREDLAADGVSVAQQRMSLEADLRLTRQQWELSIECGANLGGAAQQGLAEAFRAEYEQRYGKGAYMPGTPVELVTLRVIGRGSTIRAGLTEYEGLAEPALAPVSGRRSLYLGADRPDFGVDVVLGPDLRPGHQIDGPALIDCRDTTIWIPEGVHADVDAQRTIDLRVDNGH